MSENSASSKDNDTNSSSCGNTGTNDSPSSPGWKIQYKPMPKPESKGIWDGYQTREEFLMMHLR